MFGAMKLNQMFVWIFEMNNKLEYVCKTVNGFGLYRKPNSAGGYIYMTDEYGVKYVLWDTSISCEDDLLQAIVEERRRSVKEFENKRK